MSFMTLEGVEILLVAVYERRRCRVHPNIALMEEKYSNTAALKPSFPISATVIVVQTVQVQM